MEASVLKFILVFVSKGSSSESDDEEDGEGVSAKAFLKKKPEAAPEASKFLKSAKGSGVRGQHTVYKCTIPG